MKSPDPRIPDSHALNSKPKKRNLTTSAASIRRRLIVQPKTVSFSIRSTCAKNRRPLFQHPIKLLPSPQISASWRGAENKNISKSIKPKTPSLLRTSHIEDRRTLSKVVKKTCEAKKTAMYVFPRQVITYGLNLRQCVENDSVRRSFTSLRAFYLEVLCLVSSTQPHLGILIILSQNRPIFITHKSPKIRAIPGLRRESFLSAPFINQS